MPRRWPFYLAILPACSGPIADRAPASDAGAIMEAAAAGAGEAANASVVEDAGVAVEDTRPRLGSIAPTTWIYAGRSRKDKLGYLRPGTSVALAAAAGTEDPKRGSDCKSGRWYEVEPTGFVCEDETTTTDLEAPLFRALQRAAPRDGARPYDYAFSTRAPMYARLPSESEQHRAERRLRPVAELGKLPRSTAGHEDLALLTPPSSTDPPPDVFDVGPKGGIVRREIPYGSMLSYAASFELGGRTFLLSPDLTAVPADRVRPFRATTFHGVAVGGEVRLPIGWFRREPRVKFRRDEGGALVQTGDRWAPRTFVALTGTKVEQGGETFWETREAGLFARARDVSVVSAPDALPEGVGAGERWVDVSLSRGTLTLFAGRAAVYSTLMSPGAGGITPSPRLTTAELVGAALTPLGAYRIWFKHRAARMTSEDGPDPDTFWIADVPWIAYFRPPFAIHSAYWHEDFGLPKSGGCINLSPEDAKVVFDFTEPRVPDDWAGRVARKDERATLVVIRR